MPYITTEHVKNVRNELKRTFPDVKFSVTRHHHSSIEIHVMSSPFQWEKDYFGVNHFYPEQYENAEFLAKITEIAERGNRTVSHDGDYGAIPQFYVNIAVGKWDKPHVRRES